VAPRRPPEEVRNALARTTTSEDFRGSPQLVAFLTFVVEAALSGEGGRVKAYTIGVEAFGRGSGFDPQVDPIVRVEATRLRRTLERYYAGAGTSDPVMFELSRGTYVPSFKFRSAAVTPPAARSDQQLRRGIASQKWLLLPLAAVVLIAIGFLGPKVRLEWTSNPSTTSATPARGDLSALPVLRPGGGMPTLLVASFDVVGAPDPRAISASALHDWLSDAFSKFDLVNVIWEPTVGGAEAARTSPPYRLPVDYRFAGSVEYAPGVARIGFRLIDAGDGAVVWSRVFEERTGERDAGASEEAIARELTATLVQPFGVIYAYGRRQAANDIGDPRYRCLLGTVESFRSLDSGQTSGSRACLEQLTSLDPAFGLGWTYLAPLYLREYLYGFDARPDDLPPLERASRAAQRGVELNPASARAHEMLFTALFARHDVAAAFAAGEKAMELNRYDMRIAGAYGARKIAVGEIDAGMEILRQASGDGTMLPAFEQFFLFAGSYLKGDTERAAFHAGQLTGDTFQLGLMARALVAFTKHDRDASEAPSTGWWRRIRSGARICVPNLKSFFTPMPSLIGWQPTSAPPDSRTPTDASRVTPEAAARCGDKGKQVQAFYVPHYGKLRRL
jgi:TolB-like protein